jgi:hypothetical protein
MKIIFYVLEIILIKMGCEDLKANLKEKNNHYNDLIK